MRLTPYERFSRPELIFEALLLWGSALLGPLIAVLPDAALSFRASGFVMIGAAIAIPFLVFLSFVLPDGRSGEGLAKVCLLGIIPLVILYHSGETANKGYNLMETLYGKDYRSGCHFLMRRSFCFREEHDYPVYRIESDHEDSASAER